MCWYNKNIKFRDLYGPIKIYQQGVRPKPKGTRLIGSGGHKIGFRKKNSCMIAESPKPSHFRIIRLDERFCARNFTSLVLGIDIEHFISL